MSTKLLHVFIVAIRRGWGEGDGERDGNRETERDRQIEGQTEGRKGKGETDF